MSNFLKSFFSYTLYIGLVIICVDFTFGKLLSRIENNNQIYYPRLRWDDFYKADKNSLDVLFVGSSHCYRAFNPLVFDSLTLKKSFNLGSSAQTPVTTLFVLEEAFKTQKPEIVVFEIFPGVWKSKNYSTSAKFNYEFIRSSDIRKKMLMSGFKDVKEAFQLNFLISRYKRIVRYGMKGLFRSSLKSPDFDYVSKGFVGTYKSNKSSFKEWTYNLDKIEKKQIEYIDKIKKFCADQDVKLCFVINPYNPDYLTKCQNYKDVHEMALTITKGYKLIDFNMLDFSFDPNVDFYDSGHTSYKGADKLTKYFADLYQTI